MADLDATLDGQHWPLPSGDGSPASTLRMSATKVGLGQVAAPVGAGEVEVGLVGAADEVGSSRPPLRSAITFTGLTHVRSGPR